MTDSAVPEDALASVFREEGGRLTALLMRVLGSLEVAEDIVQDALVIALERWPREGIPRKPDAWLLTVSRRLAIDKLRRDARYREKLIELERLDRDEPEDSRLRLIFTCCHPALARETQIALTLRTVCGLSTAEIAHAFVASEQATAQRLVRARKKIQEARIPYRIPPADELNERLNAVLAVIYLMFNEGYLSSGGGQPTRRELTEEAEWLASLLSTLMPLEPEVLGLLALIRLHRARAVTRFHKEGALVLLRDQDRALWDQQLIAAAGDLIVKAARMFRPGPYQLQAAIVACHAEASSWEETDWSQILALYDSLLRLGPTPVVQLNRAVALSKVHGAKAALQEVESLGTALGRYHLYHATRAELLRELGHDVDAQHADSNAIELTANPAERALLELRLG